MARLPCDVPCHLHSISHQVAVSPTLVRNPNPDPNPNLNPNPNPNPNQVGDHHSILRYDPCAIESEGACYEQAQLTLTPTPTPTLALALT